MRALAHQFQQLYELDGFSAKSTLCQFFAFQFHLNSCLNHFSMCVSGVHRLFSRRVSADWLSRQRVECWNEIQIGKLALISIKRVVYWLARACQWQCVITLIRFEDSLGACTWFVTHRVQNLIPYSAFRAVLAFRAMLATIISAVTQRVNAFVTICAMINIFSFHPFALVNIHKKTR